MAEETFGIKVNVEDRVTDFGLVGFQAVKEFNDMANKKTNFFDTYSLSELAGTVTEVQQSTRYNLTNKRFLTFDIPLIDALVRSNPILKKAVNWQSSKPLINGIDINSKKLSSDEIAEVQYGLKTLYNSLKEVSSYGISYGGAGGLLWFKDIDYAGLKNPFRVGDMKKNTFLGIKPLQRWYQIEPAIEMGLIKKLGDSNGIYDAGMLGKPEFYWVNLSGGTLERTDSRVLVHCTRLLIYNTELVAFIEKQIERYWGASIVELSWEDLVIFKDLWSAVVKSARKNNMGILKIKGLGMSSTLSKATTQKIMNKISLMKTGSSQNVVPIDSEDAFDFVNSSLTGFKDVLELAMRMLSGSLNSPVSALFPNEKEDKEDKLYLQSIANIKDIQERIIRKWYEQLIPIIIKDKIGRKIDDYTFDFKPIEAQSLEEKANVMKTMTETLNIWYENGWIDKASGIQMLNDLNDNPTNIPHNIIERYSKELIERAEKGDFETKNSDQINVAKALNQFQKNSDGKGASGVNNPISENEGKSKGGNPTKSKGVFKRNALNEKKGKE